MTCKPFRSCYQRIKVMPSCCTQDLMAAAPDTPQVVEACCLPRRQERLDQLLEQLELCEKALQVQ